ncbi:gp102 [Rhodococcus phage ReqiDocB7]|uniref:helicase n=1 Tax=Rhodococcus phage ReqiDocB7 TaxID=691966 RepID=UPI0001CDD87F|nr:helicase [Rhodococcus phage ReqiDocB7]ADD80888.1 gp102 [Rhodococcus phage ReqiDocB7]
MEAKKGNSSPKPQPSAAMPDMSEAIPTDVDKDVLPEHIAKSDKALDDLIDRISFAEAYDKWVGKKREPEGFKDESIMISCPIPGHVDNNPSAWYNRIEKLWHCMACGKGGDIWTIASYHFNIPDYQTNPQSFHDLRREIGKSYGWSFENENGYLVGYSPEERATRAKELEEQAKAPVVDIETGMEVEDEDDSTGIDNLFPRLNWEEFVATGTFLDSYMSEASKDTAPEEFHFWHALQALGLAVGRNVYMEEEYPYYSNLYICAVGATGSGKSKAKRALDSTLRLALPYDETHATKDGVYVFPRAASGEVLVSEFKGEHRPNKNGPAISAGDVKGFVSYEEMSDIAGRSKRLGSTLKETLQELYDGNEAVSNMSKTGGKDVALRPFCCVSTGTQPDMLKKLLNGDDAASGFLNRFIFVNGTYKKPPAISTTRIDMSEPADMLKDIHEWSKSHGDDGLQIEWGDDARAYFEDFHEEHLVQWSRPEAPGSIKRITFVIKKLVLLFAINAMEEVVSIESAERACGMYDFLLESYMSIDKTVTQSLTSAEEEMILKFLQERFDSGKKWTGVGTVAKHFKRKGIDSKELLGHLDNLVKLGQINTMENPPHNGGRGAPIKGRAYIPA